MDSQKCSIERCNNDVFENDSKCIFHCEKANWNKIVDSDIIWDDTKVSKFWKAIRYEIKNRYSTEEMRYNKVIFPEFEDYVLDDTSYSAENLIGNFLNDEPDSNNIQYKIYFDKCIFLDDVLFINYIFKVGLTFNECICLKRISFSSCELNGFLNIFSSSLDALSLFESKISFIVIDQSVNSDFTNNMINEVSIMGSSIRIEVHKLTVNEFSIRSSTLDDYSSLSLQYFGELSLTGLTINGSFIVSGEDNRKYSKLLYMSNIYLSDVSRVIIGDLLLNSLMLHNNILAGNNSFSIANIDISNELSIHNCILDNAIFNQIRFSSHSNVKINYTQVDKCVFSNMKWEYNNFYKLNSETLNQIKYSYDSRGNIIEANKFYAAEMSAKSKEKMSWEDRIIFKLHELSSNHSQDWFRPLLLIMLVTLLYSLSICSSITLFNQISTYMDKLHVLVGGNAVVGIYGHYLIFVSILLSVSYWSIKNLNSFLVLFLIVLFVIYSNYCDDDNLQKFVHNLNFASLFRTGDKTIGMFILNLIQAYLSYQFIVSIRQNTRRK